MLDLGSKAMLGGCWASVGVMVGLCVVDPHAMDLIVHEFYRSDSPHGSIFAVVEQLVGFEKFVLLGLI